MCTAACNEPPQPVTNSWEWQMSSNQALRKGKAVRQNKRHFPDSVVVKLTDPLPEDSIASLGYLVTFTGKESPHVTPPTAHRSCQTERHHRQYLSEYSQSCNLLANSRRMSRTRTLIRDSVIVSWLPPGRFDRHVVISPWIGYVLQEFQTSTVLVSWKLPSRTFQTSRI